MPQTPLHQHFDLAFEPVENAGVSVGHQEERANVLKAAQLDPNTRAQPP